jgi:hypothetical protein
MPDAIPVLREAVSKALLGEDISTNHHMLGRALFETGQAKEAVKVLRTCIKVSAQHPHQRSACEGLLAQASKHDS